MRARIVLSLALAACARSDAPSPDAPRAEAALAEAPLAGTLPRTAAVVCDAARADVRSCVYSNARGRVRIVDSLSNLRHLYVDDRGQWRELPRFYGTTLWSVCEMPQDSSHTPRSNRVAIADVDGDGRDDLVVVADCITGIGPTGAQPFAVGAIYVQRSPGQYAASDARDSTFTQALPESCDTGPCDIVSAARAALRSARSP